MKSVFVYCEVENQEVAEISQELLSAGKRLAQKLGCPLDAMLFGKDLDGIESQISPYGVDKLFISDDSRLEPYTTLPHAALAHKVLKEQNPQIVTHLLQLSQHLNPWNLYNLNLLLDLHMLNHNSLCQTLDA